MKTIMRIIIFIALLLLTGLGGCHNDEETPGPSFTSSRTVVVYLGVDNNFSGEDAEKIENLTRGWKALFNGHLLVYADPKTTGSSAHRDGLPYLTEIVWENGKAVAKEVKRYEENNSADPQVFGAVLSDIVADYPAQSYGLIVLSHGSGWLPTGSLAQVSSVISDGNDEMEIRDFVKALPVKMDFIVFDACLMGGVEVAYEFKDKADYLVISPAEVLVPGFMYATMMDYLMLADPDLTAVAREFYEYYDRQNGMMRSATVSVVKVDELEALADLSRQLLEDVDGENRVDISQIQRFGYGRNYLYFDFSDYINALEPDQVAEFQKVLDKCLVYKAATPGYYSSGTYNYSTINTYSGLTIYIPQAAYPYINSEYKKLKWVQRVNPYIPE